MIILYVGNLTIGGTALQRARALQDLGHELTLVDTAKTGNVLASVAVSGVRKLFGHVLDFAGANRRALDAVASTNFELVWIDKGLAIRTETLREIRVRCPGARLIAYSPDDMAGRHNQSPRYLAGVPLYDAHVTTKSFNVPELYELGASQVVFVDNGYDPATHRPVELSSGELEEYGADVAFVGTYEDDRGRFIQELARQGLPVEVWGSDWKRNRYPNPNVHIRGRPVYSDEYAKVLNATRINLCFLRKLNRDRQTSRSVEIPACRAFMLAERTEEHERLFTEGLEAEYFETPEEMIQKCRFYLKHDSARRKIAMNARKRCVQDGYSNQMRLKSVLETIMTATV